MNTNRSEEDQAAKGKRAGAIVTLIVSCGLVLLQFYLLGASWAAKPSDPAIVLGRCLFFAPLTIALLVGLPAFRSLREPRK